MPIPAAALALRHAQRLLGTPARWRSADGSRAASLTLLPGRAPTETDGTPVAAYDLPARDLAAAGIDPAEGGTLTFGDSSVQVLQGRPQIDPGRGLVTWLAVPA